jgi:hypothetical protein
MLNHAVSLKMLCTLAGLEQKPYNKAHKAVETALKELSKKDPAWRNLYSREHGGMPPAEYVKMYMQIMGLNKPELWKFQQACVEAAEAAKPKVREERKRC